MLPLSDSSAVGDLNSRTCHHDSLLEFWSRMGSELEFGLFWCWLLLVSQGLQ